MSSSDLLELGILGVFVLFVAFRLYRVRTRGEQAEPEQGDHLSGKAKPGTTYGGFQGTLTVFGAIFGGLSIFVLLEEGWRSGFAAPVEVVVNYYQVMLGLLLGWLEPYLRYMVDTVRSWTDLDLHLQTWWKTSAIALGIVASGFGFDKRSTSLTLSVIGFCIGIALATMPFNLPPDSSPVRFLFELLGANMILVGAVLLGVLFFLVGLFASWALRLLFQDRPDRSQDRPDRKSRGSVVDFLLVVFTAAWVVQLFSLERLGSAGARILAVFSATAIWILSNAGLRLLNI